MKKKLLATFENPFRGSFAGTRHRGSLRRKRVFGGCLLSVVSALTLLLTFAACASKDGDKKQTELVIFAAASMTETLTEIAKLYKEAAPNVNLVFNFDSSGTLKTQIRLGAECDVFISAGQSQMNELADGDLIENRLDLLENKVVLAVSPGNSKSILGFEDLAERLTSGDGDILLAIGNSDVPVGQYTMQIFEYFGLDASTLNITYGGNVKEVTTQVANASADCGIIYRTDAKSAGIDIIDYATSDMYGQVVYPAATLRQSGNSAAAKAFLDFLRTDAATSVFEAAGFSEVANG